MNRGFRRMLFYISIVIFLVAGAVLVTYAEGFKFNFINWKFVKTGSLQLKANASAEIYINDKFEGSTSFFGDAFTASRLLPKTYNIKVENTDYGLWQKNAEIKAGLVTDFPRIVLVPKNISEDFVASSSFGAISKIVFDKNTNSAILTSKNLIENINLDNGKKTSATPPPVPTVSPSILPSPSLKIPVLPGGNMLVSPDGQKNVWFNDHEIWIEWLINSDYQPFMIAGDVRLITRYSNKINDVQWYRDSVHLFASVGGIISFIETDTRGGLNSYDIANAKPPFYYSLSADAIYKFEGNQLIRINLKMK